MVIQLTINLISNFGSSVDNIIVGKFLSSDCLAACGLVMPIVSFAGVLSGVITTGIKTICSRSIGEGNRKKANEQVSTAAIFSLVFFTFISVLCYVFVDQISLVLANNEPGVLRDLVKNYMLGSGLLCLICYMLAALSPNPVIGLIGCIVCGFSVAIMWPGTISISSKQLPTGGTAMFALLAMAGDLGGAFGPSLVGNVSQMANDDLHIGILAGSIFPVILIVSVLIIKIKNMKKDV